MRRLLSVSILALVLTGGVHAEDWFRMTPNVHIQFSGGDMPPDLGGNNGPDTPKPPVAIGLQALTSPLEATIDQFFSMDISVLASVTGGNGSFGVDDLVFSTDAALPEGLELDGGGLLAGTPTALTIPDGVDFEVVASHSGSLGKQVYTIVVNGVQFEVSAIAAGQDHTCAITTTGGVKCWGSNGFGQLGDATNISRQRAVDVQGLSSDVKSIAAGGYHTCALTNAGAIKCWGYNYAGQLGVGNKTNSNTPINVIGLGIGVRGISAGVGHTCVLTTAGGLKCWGRDNYGQVGNDSSTTDQTTPVNVQGLTSGVRSVAAGWAHTCAITNAGAVKCWGYNSSSQIGNGNNTNQRTPVDVVGVDASAASIAAGHIHTCVVTEAGGAKCWGRVPSSSTNTPPSDVPGLTSGVESLALGYYHSCALTASNGIKCWGTDTDGQLGDNTAIATRTMPTDVLGLTSGVTAVVAGYYHNCAALADGNIKCWGRNDFGQLGIDATGGTRPTPQDVFGF